MRVSPMKNNNNKSPAINTEKHDQYLAIKQAKKDKQLKRQQDRHSKRWETEGVEV
jgi:hypothetical protein